MTDLINNIISQQNLIALGLTMMHSLWIGAIISIITALFLRSIKGSSYIRYYISLLSFSLIVILSVIIFINLSTSKSIVPGGIAAVKQSSQISYEAGIASAYGGQQADSSFGIIMSNIEKFCSSNYNVLALIWLAGVIIMSIRFTGGYLYTRKLRNQSANILPDNWQSRISDLARKTGLKKKIKAVCNHSISTPMITGWLKPVLLLPTSVLANIPSDQLELIILHELAHIKRNDYLVNIVQSVAEIIFFFNPAIWWLSDILRIEREYCCDDIAIGSDDKKLNYARALLSIGENEYTDKLLVQTLFRNNNKLLTRIKRMTAMKNKNENKDRIIAVTGIIALFIMFGLFTGFSTVNQNNNNDMQVKIADLETRVNLTRQDTSRERNSATIKRDWIDPADGIEKDVRMKIESGEVVELYIDGQLIPEAEYSAYEDLIDETIDDYEEAIRELENIDMEEIKRKIEASKKEIENIDMEEIKKEVEAAREEIEDIDMKEIEKEIEAARKEIENIDMEKIRIEVEAARKEMEKINFEDIEIEIKEALKEIEDIDIEEMIKEIEINLDKIEDMDYDFDTDLKIIMKDDNMEMDKNVKIKKDKKSREKRKQTLKELEGEK